jgi:hypothetical protein
MQQKCPPHLPHHGGGSPRALRATKLRVRELFGELIEGQ